MDHEKKDDELLVYGYHPVIEAIRQNKPIHKVVLQSGDFNEQTKKLWFDLKDTDILIQRWPKPKIDRMVKGNHQGILAFVSPVEFAELNTLIQGVLDKGEVPTLCWLDGVSDVRNLGAIMRSAACFGVHGVILPSKSGATLTADVVRSSAGAIYHIPLVRSKNTQQTLKELSQKGLYIMALTEKGETPLDKADKANPTCLVMGDEGDGISRDILDFADGQFKIPMQGKVASLNVSVAAGVVFYEWSKGAGSPAE